MTIKAAVNLMLNLPQLTVTIQQNYHRPTNQQTDRQTDIRGHRDVTLPFMVILVGGIGEEKWTQSCVRTKSKDCCEDKNKT